ncbi:DUF4843 domain-containing protein [Sphingobacterium spiritivorum]|uniref:DUF4843 domain-containing protein n=1 Tax=Sphingobacterium spiritivorum TaxID=258 RepID=UPI003DA3BC47
MKNYTYFIIVACFVMATIVSCQKDQYYYFNDVARIQFGPPQYTGKTIYSEYADTTKSATFYYEDSNVKLDTVYFDIYTIGGIKNTDRVYKIQQLQLAGLDNAVPGKHYIAFDDPSIQQLYVIKADSVHAQVPVILKRDPELKSKTLNLGIVVQENENFKFGEQTKLWRKLSFTDRLSKPDAWTASISQYYFGPYSVVKHAFMIEVTNERWDQTFMSNLPLDVNNYYKSFLATALINYNKEHPTNPLKDENGVIIFFP